MAKSSRALEIIPQDQIPLSRNQKEFNRLTAKIEKLRREIASRTDLYETLFAAAVEHIIPADEAEARARLALAATLDKLASANRYDRVVKQDLAACIQDLCSQAFQAIEPSDEEKALYGRWSDSSYDEELEAQMAEEKDMFEFMMRDMFGMDVNMDELRDDPERFQQFQEELKEKVNSGPASSGRRKETKAQEKARAAKEAKAKAAEELKSKSVRSIYISLAKLVHPDTETDELQRAVKEEEMKKLSAAYEAKDLPTLLKMEMDWMHRQTDHLGNIADEKLALYVKVLKDQAEELEQEMYNVGFDPRFDSVRSFAWGTKVESIKRVVNQGKKIQKAAKAYEKDAQLLSSPGTQDVLKKFLKGYLRKLHRFWI